VKLIVDKDRCMGHGRCWNVAPDLLTYDAEGYVAIPEGGVEVPQDGLEAAREAVASCPEEALALTDG
jgi:ferredoxin